MSTTATRRPAVAPDLDDPVAFAHQLYSDLAAGGERLRVHRRWGRLREELQRVAA